MDTLKYPVHDGVQDTLVSGQCFVYFGIHHTWIACTPLLPVCHSIPNASVLSMIKHLVYFSILYTSALSSSVEHFIHFSITYTLVSCAHELSLLIKKNKNKKKYNNLLVTNNLLVGESIQTGALCIYSHIPQNCPYPNILLQLITASSLSWK